MTDTGIMLPNGVVTSSEAARVQALNCQAHLDLHYWPDRWQAYRNVHIRIDKRGNELNGAEDANQVTGLYSKHPYIQTWRIRNEPNLESPLCNSNDWYRYLSILADKTPDNIQLFIPAISPGLPNWVDWFRASVKAKYGFSGIDAHIYGDTIDFKNTLQRIRDFYDGRLIITEYNFGAGRPYDLNVYAEDWPEILQIAQAYEVEICFVFIWRWINPDMYLPTSTDVINSPMEHAMTVTEYEVGEGFKKVAHLVGPWLEPIVYHFAGTDHEIGVAKGAKGTALWDKSRNETYAYCSNGEIWADYGNYGNGLVRRFR